MIEKNSIELFSYTGTGDFSFTIFKISDCIEKQNQSLCGFIQQVIEKMRSMEHEHKDKYMQNKLRNCFPTDPQYCIGKIFEAINLIDAKDQGESEPQRIGREGRISLAFSHANTLIKAVDKFNGEFAERGLQEVYQNVLIEIEHSKYPLEKLEIYFDKTSKSSINSMDARAYADSAKIHILDLVECATDLDSEYSSTT
ncbi:hypothetical protein KA005_03745 [bacterium]|nr:hypothetical protein [bacterium]